MMETSQEVKAIFAALSKAQAKIETAKKDAENPYFSSKYATLASVWDACREAVTDNDLAVVQTVSTTEQGNPAVTTMLAHSSGQWIKACVSCKPEKQTPQGLGSAITYLRRYSLAAMVGVAPEDDDGNAAENRNGNHRKKEPSPPRPEREETNYEIYDDVGEQVGALPREKWMDKFWLYLNSDRPKEQRVKFLQANFHVVEQLTTPRLLNAGLGNLGFEYRDYSPSNAFIAKAVEMLASFCGTPEELAAWAEANKSNIAALNEANQAAVREEYGKALARVNQAPMGKE